MNGFKEVKAIPTVYGGQKFRSRLEARWAYFFDSLKIPYIYEPEGLDIDGVKYLPDFYLPDCKQWFEVKGVMKEWDQVKIDALRNAGHSVTVGKNNGVFEACDNDPDGFFATSCESWLCQCRNCGKYWFMGSGGFWTCQCCGTYDGDHHFEVIMDASDPKEWEPAMMAHFEYKETPKIFKAGDILDFRELKLADNKTFGTVSLWTFIDAQKGYVVGIRDRKYGGQTAAVLLPDWNVRMFPTDVMNQYKNLIEIIGHHDISEAKRFLFKEE